LGNSQVTTPADEQVQPLLDNLQTARAAIAAHVIGQEEVIDQLLIALITGGHVLLEGAPGVGKTLLVRTIGRVTGLRFARIQFTPDLMPADVTGSLALVPDDAGRMVARFQSGPIFTQILLADEINRATPKTQSALLEAMQEGTVTAGGRTMDLPRPFFVLATQNPLEMDGTYLLPEAQIDRFLFKSLVRYPDLDALGAILDLNTIAAPPAPEPVLAEGMVLRLQALVREMPLASHLRLAVAGFALDTQPDRAESPRAGREALRWGLSPRGAQALVLAAKGHALLHGRPAVGLADLRAVLLPVLRHRLLLTYQAEAEGVVAEDLITRLFAQHAKAAA